MAGIRIHIIDCGKIGVAPGLLGSGGNRFQAEAEALRTPEKKRVWLPVRAYLIEHPKGLVLVDTGLPRAVSPRGVEDRAAQIKTMGLGYYNVFHAVLGPGEAIDERLAAMGVRPSDLDVVALTHLDTDTAGGVMSLREAKRFLVSDEEYFWSCRVNMRYRRELWLPRLPVSEKFYYKVKNLGPESRYLDVFGDEAIQLVSVSGHSFGNFAVMIKNAGRFVLLTSDACMTPANWRELTAPGMSENAERLKKGVRWIRELADSPDCAAVLAGHDPEIEPGVIEI